MNRKTLTITALVIIFILLGIGIYFYLSKTTATPIPPTSAFPGEGLPVTSTRPTGVDEGGAEVSFTPGTGAPLPRLYELHKLPVAGVSFIDAGKGTSITTTARYIERGLGYIFDTPLNTYSESRVVNETRTRLSEALWGNGGKSVVVRYLDSNDGVIKTRIVNIGAPTVSFSQSTSTETATENFLNTEEVFLPDYIPFMSVAEDGADKVFYLENGTLSAIGTVSTLKNTGSTGVLSSSFTEWLPQFPNQNLITLTTKPSAVIPGHLFFIDTKTNALTKVLGNINGLTTLTSRDGKLVLYAEIKNKVPELSIYDTVKKETRVTSLQTLPEKCAWSSKKTTVAYCAAPQSLPLAVYPDQWYQGLLSFSDDVWKIDTTTGVVEKVLTPSSLRAPALDIINPVLSSDDTYLIFMNKTSGTPWVYRIAEDAPIATSTPALPATTAVTDGMTKIR